MKKLSLCILLWAALMLGGCSTGDNQDTQEETQWDKIPMVMEGFIIVQNPQGKETIIVRNILSQEVGESIEFGVPTGGKTHSVRFLKFVTW